MDGEIQPDPDHVIAWFRQHSADLELLVAQQHSIIQTLKVEVSNLRAMLDAQREDEA